MCWTHVTLWVLMRNLYCFQSNRPWSITSIPLPLSVTVLKSAAMNPEAWLLIYDLTCTREGGDAYLKSLQKNH